jgi:hypothetical protein
MARTGRPKIPIDYEQLEKLAALHCTDEEIAEFFGCSYETLRKRKHDDEEFLAAYRRGRSRASMALRRMQWDSARDGDVRMLMFLGKHVLKQGGESQSDNVSDDDAENALLESLRRLEAAKPAELEPTKPAVVYTKSENTPPAVAPASTPLDVPRTAPAQAPDMHDDDEKTPTLGAAATDV